MVRRGYERVWQREDGLRRVRGVTTWVTAGAAAVSVLFGGVFAASRTLAGSTTGGTGTGSGNSVQQPARTGQADDGGGTGSGTGQSNSGQPNAGSGGFQAPAQAPRSNSGGGLFGGGGQVSSGGS